MSLKKKNSVLTGNPLCMKDMQIVMYTVKSKNHGPNWYSNIWLLF